MKRLALAEAAIVACAVWLVWVSKRPGQQELVPSMADNLRVTALAVVIAAIAGSVAWLAQRRHETPVLVGALVAVALLALVAGARRPAVPAWATVVANAAWLGGAAAVMLVIGLVVSGRGSRTTRALRFGAAAVAITGAVTAVVDRGDGLGSTIGALQTASIAPAARLMLCLHLVTLAACGVMAAWSIRGWGRTSWVVTATASVWLAIALVERALPLLPVTSYRDLARDSYRPWSTVLAENLPAVALIALLVAMGWVIAMRPTGTTGGVLRLRERDPVALLHDDLAAWLGDPSLQIGFADAASADGSGGWVTPHGAMRLETAHYDRAETVVTRRGEPVAVLVHDVALSAAPDALATASALAGVALDTNQLLAVSEGRLAEAHRMSERLLVADATTRADVLGLLERGPLARLRRAAAGARFGAPLAEVHGELRAATSDVRRLSHGIHPAELVDGGLRAAMPGREGVPARRLPPAVEITAWLLAHDDPEARFEDHGTVLRVIRSTGSIPQDVLDRVAVLGGTIDGVAVSLPVDES